MQLLAASVVLLVCSGLAAGQAACDAATNGFSAFTIDALEFVSSRSYHSNAGLTLYERDDNTTQVFDFSTGSVFERGTDGNCVEYQSSDLKLLTVDIQVLAAQTRQAFSSTDRAGVTRVGSAVTNGNLVVETATDGCYTFFISFTFNGKVRWDYAFYNQEGLTDAEVQRVQAARNDFAESNCPVKAI